MYSVIEQRIYPAFGTHNAPSYTTSCVYVQCGYIAMAVFVRKRKMTPH